MKIILEIGGKPEAKGRGRVGRVNGKDGKSFATVFTPSHTRKYETRIRDAAYEAMDGREPIAGAVEVFVHAYLPYPKSLTKKQLAEAVAGRIRPCTKPDIDNYIKSALDGINNIIIMDDNQVVSVHGYKVYRNAPALRIEIRECLLSGEPSEAEKQRAIWEML